MLCYRRRCVAGCVREDTRRTHEEEPYQDAYPDDDEGAGGAGLLPEELLVLGLILGAGSTALYRRSSVSARALGPSSASARPAETGSTGGQAEVRS